MKGDQLVQPVGLPAAVLILALVLRAVPLRLVWEVVAPHEHFHVIEPVQGL